MTDPAEIRADAPKVGERVLFIEDGNYVCGTVVPYPENQATPAEGWAIRGDLGGIHWGSDPLGNWAWRISDVADALADPTPVGLTDGYDGPIDPTSSPITREAMEQLRDRDLQPTPPIVYHPSVDPEER